MDVSPTVRDGLRRWMDNLEDSDGNQCGPNNQRFQRQNNATSRRKAQCQEHVKIRRFIAEKCDNVY